MTLVSRFGVGWLLGGVMIMAYHALRPHLPFWLFVVAAALLAVAGGHLAEKYLPK